MRTDIISNAGTKLGVDLYQFIHTSIVIPMGRDGVAPDATRHGRRIADLLYLAREQAGLSREALAREAGVSMETIRAIERGRTPTPAFYTVACIARSLGLSLDALDADAVSHSRT